MDGPDHPRECEQGARRWGRRRLSWWWRIPGRWTGRRRGQVNIAIANRFFGLLCIESYIQHEKIDDGWFFFFYRDFGGGGGGYGGRGGYGGGGGDRYHALSNL